MKLPPPATAATTAAAAAATATATATATAAITAAAATTALALALALALTSPPHPHPQLTTPQGVEGGDNREKRRLSWPPPKPMQILTGHTDRVYTVDWHPLEPCLATGSADGTLRLWAPARGRRQEREPRKGAGGV